MSPRAQYRSSYSAFIDLIGGEAGDHEPWGVLARQDLGLGDDTTFARPALLGPIVEVLVGLRRVPALGDDLAMVLEIALDHLGQPAVPRKADDELNSRLALAPVQHRIAAEPRIRTDDEFGPRPLFTDVGHDASDFFERPGGAVLVGSTELGREQELPTEDVQR